MRKAILAVAAALLASGAWAEGGEKAKPLQVVDSLLGEAASLIDGLEKSAAKALSVKDAKITGGAHLDFIAKASQECEAKFTLDSLKGGATLEPFYFPLQTYYRCRSAVEGRKACKPLADPAFDKHAESNPLPKALENCEQFADRIELGRLMITKSPKAFDTCMAQPLPLQDKAQEKPEFKKQACDLIVRSPKARHELCHDYEDLLRITRTPQTCHGCQFTESIFRGEQDGCALSEVAADQADCQGMAAYKRAVDKKDAAECGTSPLCRALMGEGVKACEGTFAAVRKTHCSDVAQNLWRDEDARLQAEDRRMGQLRQQRSEALESINRDSPRVKSLLDEVSMALERTTKVGDVPAGEIKARDKSFQAQRSRYESVLKKIRESSSQQG